MHLINDKYFELKFKKTILAFIIPGLAGVALDFDHLIPPLKNAVPLTQIWGYMVQNGVRDFHILGLWASFMVFLYCWGFEDE